MVWEKSVKSRRLRKETGSVERDGIRSWVFCLIIEERGIRLHHTVCIMALILAVSIPRYSWVGIEYSTPMINVWLNQPNFPFSHVGHYTAQKVLWALQCYTAFEFQIYVTLFTWICFNNAPSLSHIVIFAFQGIPSL